MRRATIGIATLAACAFGFVPLATRSADSSTGYVGKGALVVQTSFGGATNITIGGSIAFEESDPNVRLDVLSLGIPGADPTLGAIASTQLLPAGGFTIVYDRVASSYIVWSNTKRNYFASPPKAQSTPAPSPTAPAAGSKGLFAPFGLLRALADDKAFNLSIALTGHGVVNGHPATAVTFAYLKTTSKNETTDIHGQLQLADDLNEIPVQVMASVKTPNIPLSSARLDFSSIVAATPAASDFTVPAGYARASSLGDVVGRTLSF